MQHFVYLNLTKSLKGFSFGKERKRTIASEQTIRIGQAIAIVWFRLRMQSNFKVNQRKEMKEMTQALKLQTCLCRWMWTSAMQLELITETPKTFFFWEQLVYNPFLKMSQLHVMLCYVTWFDVLTEPINAWPRLTAKLNYYVRATVRISTIFNKGPFVGLTLEVFRHNRVECCCSRYNFVLTRKLVNCVSIGGAINC